MKPAFLTVDRLEDRTTPSAATLGSPWPDASALTLSFAPDGTSVAGQKSELFKTLTSTGSSQVWQREVLRAFQSWAVFSDINIAVTKDSGEAVGTPGETQGDTRFGDIRVAARPLAADSLANVSPYDWSIGTWSGDVLLNSDSLFGLAPAAGRADLYSVLLHEAGHVFGLAHSEDPGSAMFERYAGLKLGPAADDVIALQSVYGPRSADAYEGPAGNDTPADARALTGAGNLAVTGDIGGPSDVDFFTFTVPAGADKFAVRVRTAGLSSLVPGVTVYDALGRVVGSESGSDPLDPKELEVKLKADEGATFTVRVAGATGDVFAVGRYDLRVDYRDQKGGTKSSFDKDGGADDTVVTAADLGAGRKGGWLSTGDSYARNGSVEGKSDLDHYRLAAPVVTAGTAEALTVSVRFVSAAGSRSAPSVTVYDEAGTAVPSQVVSHNGPTLTIQVPGVRRGATYIVRVAAGADGGTGNYRLTADFGEAAPSGLGLTQAGSLTGIAPQSFGTLTVENGRLFQFALSTAGAGTAAVRLTVLDDRGRAVLTVNQSVNGRPVNAAAYLPTGIYRVVLTLTGTGTPATRFWLFAGVFSDPVGPYAPGTGGTGGTTSPPPPPPTTTGTDPGYTYTGTSQPPPAGYPIKL